MPSRDETPKPLNPATNAVHRRGFLQFLAAAFATAALPEVLDACTSLAGDPEGPGELAESVDFSASPMVWVTRRDDGLSLGIQLSGMAADSNHNLALKAGTAAGNGFIALTFPPQHVIEDAALGGTTPTLPVAAYASGVSRIVFQVPASYGAAADAGGIPLAPYTLQGVLALCARSTTAVASNAASNAGLYTFAANKPVVTPVDAAPQSLAQAKIDRVIARVDPEAAARVMTRTAIAAGGELTIIHLPTHHGTSPVKPANGETSLEVPHRLLLSPNEAMAWSYSATPITSLQTHRTEVWNVRMGQRNHVTGLADPSLGNLSVRALWTRDYDVDGEPAAGASYADAGTPITEPVKNAVPTAYARNSIVQATGDMSGTWTPPLALNRMMLTPLGASFDVNAAFSTGQLAAWTQRISLGRDEFAETVTRGHLLPFGHPASLVQINHRNDNPANGPVGVLYTTSYLVVGAPLVSYAGRSNAQAYNTFPFAAVEISQLKIPCSSALGAGAPAWIYDPTGKIQVIVPCVGTDQKGRAIRFTTPLVWVPQDATNTTYFASGMSLWNGSNQSGVTVNLDGQRVAYAPPASGDASGSSAFSTDSTSFETTSLAITLGAPASSLPMTPDNVIPAAKSLLIAIEAVRHLATSTSSGNAPSATAIFDYDQYTYAANGFASAMNPHEIFLVYTALAPGQSTAPSFDFTGDSSKSGALAAPQMGIHALSRAAGAMSGTLPANRPASSGSTPANASTALFAGTFDPTDFFKGFNPMLFGCIPLSKIVQLVTNAAGSLASKYMPKIVTQDISDAEAFLQKAMTLYQAVQNASALIAGSSGGPSLASVALTDAAKITSLLQNGLGDAGAPFTKAEQAAMQAAAAAASSAATTIQNYATQIQTIAADGAVVASDITSFSFAALIGTTGLDGHLGKLIADTQGFLTSLAALKVTGTQAATAAYSYLGALATSLQQAVTTVQSVLTGASEAMALLSDLGSLAQGLEVPKSLSAEFKWQPLIQGIGYNNVLAFVPSTAQAFNLDVVVNAKAVGATPAGANVTCRLDRFALAFGGTIPGASGWSTFSPTSYTIDDASKDADVTLVFDHMQFQTLAGQKPDIDVVFDDIHFGGPLSFVETLKDLLPLDAFSDPPFIEVGPTGITAELNLAIPDVAIGLFSLENMVLDAKLSIPFVTTNTGGVTFELDFCTPDNPFVVTVAMLGGGGFFGMTMDMNGLERVQLGIEVAAQLAINLLDIVSGCVSIEVGIFFVYENKSAVAPNTLDTVTGVNEVGGWTIGGYLRLRGEVDIAGLITVSLELYLKIIYELSTGKCVASGFIQIDVHILFFSLDVTIPFSRTFAGSNGDPTFLDLMAPGGDDPMLDPTVANNAWAPFADYCMAYA